MDWASVIERQHGALLRIMAVLFAMAGLAEGETVATLPHNVYRAVLRVLRPAESAVRRLVIIAARGLVISPRPVRAFLEGLPLLPRRDEARNASFCLIDPLKRFAPATPQELAGPIPRISIPGLYDPVFIDQQVSTAEETISAAHLCRRLLALRYALNDLPRQARRLARWKARRDLALLGRKVGRLSPFRPGRPPGHQKRPTHEVDEVLLDCHYFALEACKTLDTS